MSASGLAQVDITHRLQHARSQENLLIAILVGADGILLPSAARDVLVNRVSHPLAGFRLEFLDGQEPIHVFNLLHISRAQSGRFRR